jgi:hypothetical protein
MPQNFVAIQSSSYKVLTQHTISKIRCVDEGERQWMVLSGWTFVDGRRWMKRDGRMKPDGNWTNESHIDIR